jgi:hypothetical protein
VRAAALVPAFVLAATDASAAWVGRCAETPPHEATVLETRLSPDGGAASLIASDRPLPGCDLLEIPAERKAIAWARELAREDAEHLRDGVILQGTQARGRFAVTDVMPLTEPPRPVTGTPKPSGAAGTPRPAPKRALWVWNPAAWRERPEAVLPLEPRIDRAVVKGGLRVQIQLRGPPGRRSRQFAAPGPLAGFSLRYWTQRSVAGSTRLEGQGD